MTGQHDRQDERLTGQLSNQSGHCPLTGRYFEPWGPFLEAPDYFPNPKDILGAQYSPIAIQFLLTEI